MVRVETETYRWTIPVRGKRPRCRGSQQSCKPQFREKRKVLMKNAQCEREASASTSASTADKSTGLVI